MEIWRTGRTLSDVLLELRPLQGKAALVGVVCRTDDDVQALTGRPNADERDVIVDRVAFLFPT